jgi:hypothetical protein
MRRETFRGAGGCLMILALLLLISLPAQAMDKRVAENPLLFYSPGNAKPAVVDNIVCAVGQVYNRISNSTVERVTGTNDQCILIGDDALSIGSMRRQTPAIYAAINDYLYLGSFRVGRGSKLVHFSTDTSPGITTKSSASDSTAVSLFDTYFKISDQSPIIGPGDKFNVEVHQRTYAWSETYRADFIVYDWWVLNLNDTDLDSIFIGHHEDCDVSVPEGGSGAQAYSRDDLVYWFRDSTLVDGKWEREQISYMYDGDNPNVSGDDTGGNKIPKESTGYIGSRLLYCPPVMGVTDTADFSTIQSGSGWWDWNSDPGTDADWMARISDGLWLPPPPSVHDYRFLQKLGPFVIPAHDSIRVVVAFGVGEGLDGLRKDLGWADSLYKNSQKPELGYRWLGPSAPVAPQFTLTPGDRQVNIEWNTLAETTPDPATGQINFEGYRVWRKTGEQGAFTLLLDCDAIDDIGLNTGVVHSYLDSDVNNGFQYFYVVTAYSRGDPSIGLDSFESGKAGAIAVQPGLNVGTRDAAASGIHVVPNPFVKVSPAGFGFSPDNNNPASERLLFVNLPETANVTITVFSLTGDEIIKLKKSDYNSAVMDWDLISKNRQDVVAGLYLYVVESDKPGFKNFIGKFLVVR